jgi:hypothetical protein
MRAERKKWGSAAPGAAPRHRRERARVGEVARARIEARTSRLEDRMSKLEDWQARLGAPRGGAPRPAAGRVRPAVGLECRRPVPLSEGPHRRHQ